MMNDRRTKRALRAVPFLCALALAGCGGSDADTVSEPPPTGTGTGTSTGTGGGTNSGTAGNANNGQTIPTNTATGRAANSGFSQVNGTLTRATALGGNNFNTGVSLGAPTAMTIPGGAATSVAIALTYNNATQATGATGANYTAATRKAVIGSGSFDTTAGQNLYTAYVTNGGANQIVGLLTPSPSVPAAGTATYNGIGNVTYVNTPTAQAFVGTMDATVAASFATGKVNVTLTNPNGNIGGVAYSAGGQIAFLNLDMNGAAYATTPSSSGSLTGFTGAANLNSGTQRVTMTGIFTGPNAEETGAVGVIDDGANGIALVNLTGR